MNFGLVVLTWAFGLWSLDSQDPRTASVRVYPDRSGLLERTDELGAAGRWAEVLEIYAAALATDRDAVVAAGNERYVSVFDTIMARLASAPPEARAEYRRRFDPVAAKELGEASNRAALERVVELYPFSSHRAEALSRLARAASDDGDPAAAAAALEALLGLKEASFPREVVAARLGMAWAHAGRADRLAALREATATLTDRPVIAGSRTLPLGEFLAGLTPRAPVALAAPPPDEWPALGGDGSGHRAAPASDAAPPRAWEVALPNTRYYSEAGRTVTTFGRREPDPSLLVPAVSGGAVFLHNEYLAQAYALYARRPQLLWSFRVPEPSGELDRSPYALQTTTVLDGRVFVPLITRLGATTLRRRNIPVAFPFPTRTLFALDAATGALLWRLDERPETAGHSCALAPATDGRLLYAGLTEQRHATDPFRHSVACLDPADGRLLWKTYVAGGHTEINLFGNSVRESIGSPVVVSGDTIFYVTHHGAAAALDRVTGRLLWAERYPQWEIMPTRDLYPWINEPGWINHAPLIHEGTVTFAPIDSRLLLRRELRTGKRLGQIERPVGTRAILGLSGGRLILGGTTLLALDPDLRRPDPAWMYMEATGSGLGTVGADRIFHPVASRVFTGIHVVDADRGARRQAVPLALQTEPEFAVNLIPLEGVTLAAGPRSLAVCLDPAALGARADKIAAMPGASPELLYEAALKSMVRTDAAPTIALLRQVLKAAGDPGRARLRSAAGRHLYALIEREAVKLLEAGSYAAASTLLEEALALAPEDARVQVSLALAVSWRRSGRADRALELLHELIAGMGARPLDETTVGETARRMIAEIIADGASYAPFEAQAAARLERAAGDAAALLDVARLWPNSRAALRARGEALTAALARDRIDAAFSAVSTALQQAEPPEDAAALAVRLVEDLERRRLVHVSRSLLLMMQSRLTGQTIGEVPVLQYVAARLSAALYAPAPEPPVAPLAAPLKRVARHAEGALAGAVPLACADPGRLYFQAGATLRALDIATLRPLWEAPVPGPILHAAAASEVVVVATARSLSAFGRADGRPRWSLAQPAGIEAHAFVSGRGAIWMSRPDSRGDGEVVALDAATGIELWRRGHRGRPAVRLDLCGEALAFLASDPVHLYVENAFTGDGIHFSMMTDPSASYEVAAADARGVEIRSDSLLVGIERWEAAVRGRHWQANIAYLQPPALWAVGPTHHVGIARSSDPSGGRGWYLRAYDRAANGKFTALSNLAEPRDALGLAVTPTHAVMLMGERGKAQSLRGLLLPKLEPAWELALPPGAEPAGPLEAPGNLLLLPTVTPQAGRGLSMKVLVVGSDGKLLQTIESERPLEKPPLVEIVGDGIVISADGEIQYWKRP